MVVSSYLDYLPFLPPFLPPLGAAAGFFAFLAIVGLELKMCSRPIFNNHAISRRLVTRIGSHRIHKTNK